MIRESRDQRPFDGSPELIAVFRALRRLLAPRHPPHALSSLAALILASKARTSGLRTDARHEDGSTSYRTYPDRPIQKPLPNGRGSERTADPEIG